ncbi:MAG: hypothetical protein LBL99_01685, partial [Holosporaceae bacterium]|nr:hypothetical protein [Holosporaceae bacterium]
MMKKDRAALYVVLASLAACSSKEPLPGTREELIIAESSEEIAKGTVDPSPAVIDSSEESNAEFVQAHFNSSHYYNPLKFSNSPREIWRSNLDFESTEALKMTAAPAVAAPALPAAPAGAVVTVMGAEGYLLG